MYKISFKWNAVYLKITGILFLLLWSLPVLYLFTSLDTSNQKSSEAWSHIVENLLLRYSVGSLKMLIGTSIGVLLIGVPTAWLVSTTEFWGRKFFDWALVLPLAIPAYILAYTYAASLSYTGKVGIFLRNISDESTFIVPIMSEGGAVFIMSMALYPYVYAVSRAAFAFELGSVWEAAKMMGKSSYKVFFGVVIPLVRPFIFGGLLLVMMEVLNEYGTFKYYGVQTFTTGIFSAWAKFGDVKAALRLALCLLGVIVLLVILERKQRQRKAFQDDKNYRVMPRKELSSIQKLGAFLVCLLPFSFGFAFPVVQLVYWAVQEILVGNYFDEVWTLFFNTLLLAIWSGLVVVVVALFLALMQKRHRKKTTTFFLEKWIARLATMGYAVPGAVIAVGVLGVFLWIDKQIYSFVLDFFDKKIGFLISGTIISLVYAYAVRFLSVGFQPIEGGLTKMNPSLEAASRAMGKNSLQTLWNVTLPLLKPAMLTALLLVFVDVSKELPLTLILRPFNYDTLATKAYELADQEFVSQAALPALLIVLISLLPTILLSKMIKK